MASRLKQLFKYFWRLTVYAEISFCVGIKRNSHSYMIRSAFRVNCEMSVTKAVLSELKQLHKCWCAYAESVQQSLEKKFGKAGGSIPISPSDLFEKRMGVSIHSVA